MRTAELNSFTRAAAVLEMTQSGVSRAVSRLESALRIRLLNRTTRSLTLTPDGRVFFDRCALLLREFDEAERQLVERRDQPSGLLRISSALGYGRAILLPVVAQLARDYPGLIVEVSLTDRKIDLTEEGFDAAIRVGEIPDSRLIAKRLGVLRPVTIASPEYLERFGTPRSPDELDGHNCLTIRFPRTGRFYEWKFAEDGRERSIAVTGNVILDIADPLVDMTAAGHCIAQLPRIGATQALASKQVVPILEDYEVDTGPTVSLIYRHSRHLSSKIRVVREALADISF